MTLRLRDPRAVEGDGFGPLRWGIAGVVVASAYAAAVWLAFALPPPEGAMGEMQRAVMIELEPMTASAEAPPPAPEPAAEAQEQPVPEPVPAPVAEPPPEPQPPAPEPVAEEPPPEVVPPEPEPIVEPEPEPDPLPEPNTAEAGPDLPDMETKTAAILNPPVPTARPAPPRPRAEPERPREKPRTERPRRTAESSPPSPQQPRAAATRSSAPASEAAAAQRTASAPRVSPARWQSSVVSHIRRAGRRLSGHPRGTASVAFSIDRTGRVLSARLARSSGDEELDAEAVASVRRASPVPAPPEGIGGRTLPMTLPVKAR